MRIDWVPFSASALVVGASALSVGALVLPQAGVFALEAAPQTGAALHALTIPSLFGGTVGLLVFDALKGGAFATYDLPAYPGFEWSHI